MITHYYGQDTRENVVLYSLCMYGELNGIKKAFSSACLILKYKFCFPLRESLTYVKWHRFLLTSSYYFAFPLLPLCLYSKRRIMVCFTNAYLSLIILSAQLLEVSLLSPFSSFFSFIEFYHQTTLAASSASLPSSAFLPWHKLSIKFTDKRATQTHRGKRDELFQNSNKNWTRIMI